MCPLGLSHPGEFVAAVLRSVHFAALSTVKMWMSEELWFFEGLSGCYHAVAMSHCRVLFEWEPNGFFMHKKRLWLQEICPNPKHSIISCVRL